MAHFRTKPGSADEPHTIEAIHWFDGNTDEVVAFASPHAYQKHCWSRDHKNWRIFLNTPEGKRRLAYGDWIIKDEVGFYRFSQHLFEAVYEPVEVETSQDVLRAGSQV